MVRHFIQKGSTKQLHLYTIQAGRVIKNDITASQSRVILDLCSAGFFGNSVWAPFPKSDRAYPAMHYRSAEELGASLMVDDSERVKGRRRSRRGRRRSRRGRRGRRRGGRRGRRTQ